MVSCDELTAIQALERTAPTQSMQSGQVERREYEYVRHGTLSLIANFEVATGNVIASSLGPTRTERTSPPTSPKPLTLTHRPCGCLSRTT